jgi:enoyl-CoA hydratase
MSYEQIDVDRQEGLATITLLARHNHRGKSASHWEVGLALAQLRFEKDIRVIVLTGQDDVFLVPPENSPHPGRHLPGRDFDAIQGLQQTLDQFLQIEKPVICKVNGNAIGWGSSLVFACDFIVAREDAVICDHHLAMGETVHGGPTNFGVVPGDGGTGLVPLHMAPCIAKEYLWLGREMTGRDLAEARIINAAVPKDELDRKVAAMAQALLRRSPHALALSKRALNHLYIDAFNKTHDLSYAYELLNFYMHGRAGDGRGETSL